MSHRRVALAYPRSLGYLNTPPVVLTATRSPAGTGPPRAAPECIYGEGGECWEGRLPSAETERDGVLGLLSINGGYISIFITSYCRRASQGSCIGSL